MSLGARPADVTAFSEEDPGKPIRVLWLIKGLGRGGAELLLCHAAGAGDRQAFHYETAYALASRSGLADDLRAQGVPVHLLASSNGLGMRWVKQLRRFFLEQPFDIVHAHSPLVAGFARIAVRSLPREIRPILVSTEHVPWSGYVLPTRVFNAATFGLDQAHLAVSEAVRRSIPRILRGNVQTLIHGVPLAELRRRRGAREETRNELRVAPDEVLIGTVANFRPQKAYQDLVAAAALIVGRGRDVRFAAVGQGPTEPAMRALSERVGLGERFRFLGPRDDASTFIAGCDIFALSSHYEGLPLVVMEALALGVPVVATRVEGVTELVREGIDGILVPKAQPERFADALDSLIADGQLRARLAAAAYEGGARFDNRPAVASIEAMYRTLVDRRRTERRPGRSDHL